VCRDLAGGRGCNFGAFRDQIADSEQVLHIAAAQGFQRRDFARPRISSQARTARCFREDVHARRYNLGRQLPNPPPRMFFFIRHRLQLGAPVAIWHNGIDSDILTKSLTSGYLSLPLSRFEVQRLYQLRLSPILKSAWSFTSHTDHCRLKCSGRYGRRLSYHRTLSVYKFFTSSSSVHSELY
jgi:hypothetical protein